MVRECESIAKQKLLEHRRAPNQLTILNVLMENRVYSEFIVIVIGENCP